MTETPTQPIRTITAPTTLIPIQAAQYTRPPGWRTRLDLTILTWRAKRNNPRIHHHERTTTLAANIRNKHNGQRYQAWEHKCTRCGHTTTTYTALPEKE